MSFKLRFFLSWFTFVLCGTTIGLSGNIQATELAGVVLEREAFQNTASKTQIEQRWYVESAVTEGELRVLLSKLFDQASNQQRAEYKHRSIPNSIWIWVYASQEHAQQEHFGSSWIGMISKSVVENSGKIRVNEGRIEGLSRPRENKHGLSYEQRKMVFLGLLESERLAREESNRRFPRPGTGTETIENMDNRDELYYQLEAMHDRNLRKKYGITEEEAKAIGVEGLVYGFL